MRNSFPGEKNSMFLKTLRSFISLFPSGPIIFPPIFVATLRAGASPIFFSRRKKNPLSRSTSRMTFGLP
jgi:hypothetical protein